MKNKNLLIAVLCATFFFVVIAASNNPMLFIVLPEGGGGGGDSLIDSTSSSQILSVQFGGDVVHASYSAYSYDGGSLSDKLKVIITMRVLDNVNTLDPSHLNYVVMSIYFPNNWEITYFSKTTPDSYLYRGGGVGYKYVSCGYVQTTAGQVFTLKVWAKYTPGDHPNGLTGWISANMGTRWAWYSDAWNPDFQLSIK